MIQTKNLSIQKQGKNLINALSLTFKQGEFWAIIGKNGTGKTSLLHTLAGFSSPNKGSIEINGKKLSHFSPLSRAQHIAFLPQLLEASLNCSVEQSVSYGRYPWHKDRQQRKQDKACIEAAIKTMELGTIRCKSIQSISGGELRKVEIATILAQASQIMLLDEPLNHLDIAFRYKLMKHLKQQSKDKIVIIVTHDIQYVQQYCSHVLMLGENSDVITGTITDAMTEDNLTKILGIYEKE